MHYSTHRRLFKPGSFAGETLNELNICLYAPMFGIPCNTYRLHHIVMHHVDNNEWNKDLSATEAYQRDNVLHWVCYWVRFMVGSWVDPFLRPDPQAMEPLRAGHRRVRADPVIVVRRLALWLRRLSRCGRASSPSWRCPPP